MIKLITNLFILPINKNKKYVYIIDTKEDITLGDACIEYMNDGSIYIDYIMVQEQGNGHGKKIIKYLLEESGSKEIRGVVDERSYSFWLHIGAKINLENEDMPTFTLLKKDFN